MSSPEPAINREEVGFRPLDILLLGYVIFELAVIFLFMTGRPGWLYFAIFYAAVGSLALIFSITPMGGAWKLPRLIYPLLIISLLYKALDAQIFLIHPRPFDPEVYGFELAVFGVDIAFELQKYMEIWINELMSFSYISYYFLLPAAVVVLALRKSWEALEQFVLTACLAFFSSYVIFLLFPVVGPRFYLNDIFYLPLIGPFFTPLAQGIVHNGGLFGGAMPSSHCAVGLVAIWYLCGELKSARGPLILLLTLLCAGTVYGRYHYLTDVFVGLALGTVSLVVGYLWQRHFFNGREAAFSGQKAEPAPSVEVGIED